MTSSSGNIFCVTGHLCGEFTGHRAHKGQWRGALMFSLICAWIKRWVNNREAGDLRRHRAHYDVIVMNTSHRGQWVSCNLHLRVQACLMNNHLLVFQNKCLIDNRPGVPRDLRDTVGHFEKWHAISRNVFKIINDHYSYTTLWPGTRFTKMV